MFGIDDLIGGAVGLIGGAIGGSKKSSADQQALELRKRALERIDALNPTHNSVDFQRYNSVGHLNPQQVQIHQQDPSAMEGVQVDPGMRSAQLRALQSLGALADRGGLTLQDEANQQKLLSRQAQAEKGSRDALLNNFNARGMGGSGFALQAQLANQQNAANRANETATDIAAQAQQRALQAIMQRGQMAGSMSAQDYAQKSERARAIDAINRFNTSNRQDVANRNVDALNSAQRYNLGQDQSMANANVDTANKQQTQNNAYNQQYYQDQLNKANSYANATKDVAGAQNQMGADQAQFWGGMGKGLGDATKAAWQGFSDQAKAKKDGDGKSVYDDSEEYEQYGKDGY